MKDVLKLLHQHRSIRKFESTPLSKETVQNLVEAAQMASTSSFLQSYSIIGVTDQAKKGALRDISGQKYVEENGHLFVFVIDFHKHAQLAKRNGENIAQNLGNTESFIVGTVDAALAAQNMCIAAESMDLGICFIGSLRNDIQQVADILELPEFVVPLFGLVVGIPTDKGSQKARLPFETIYYENGYQAFEYAQYEAYDDSISQYYADRTSGKRSDLWSDQVVGMLKEKSREDVDAFVKSKGFLQQ